MPTEKYFSGGESAAWLPPVRKFSAVRNALPVSGLKRKGNVSAAEESAAPRRSRGMIAISTTSERYGTVAVAFHWIAAALIVGLLVLGVYMVSLPDAGYDRKKIVLILYHKEFGVLVF